MEQCKYDLNILHKFFLKSLFLCLNVANDL